MADTKVSSLTTIPAVDRAADYLYIVDTSAGSSNKVTPNGLLGIIGAPVGDTDSATLTNKTITSPVISGPILSGTVTGTYTLGGTPTFPSSVVTLTGSQTLTNKTLTSPTINTATISNPTLTVDTVSGFSTANSGTVYGIGIASGVITTANSIAAGTIVQNGVAASQLAASAITLGYTQITSTFTTSSATFVQVTGLTSTVTIPAGGRRTKITAFVSATSNTNAAVGIVLSIWDGVVGSGTQLQQLELDQNTATFQVGGTCIAVVSPSAGSKTYNIGLKTTAGTASFTASATAPAFILVEAI